VHGWQSFDVISHAVIISGQNATPFTVALTKNTVGHTVVQPAET
jgi:hypothetical protein